MSRINHYPFHSPKDSNALYHLRNVALSTIIMLTSACIEQVMPDYEGCEFDPRGCSAGEAVAGEEVEGGEMAGEEMAGSTIAGQEVAGEEVEGGVILSEISSEIS